MFWNSLPERVMRADLFMIFKRKLDGHLREEKKLQGTSGRMRNKTDLIAHAESWQELDR